MSNPELYRHPTGSVCRLSTRAHTHTHSTHQLPHTHTHRPILRPSERSHTEAARGGGPPMVQFVVIFLRFGLCRSSSSSLFVGSHVVYFSPIPEHTHTIIIIIRDAACLHETFQRELHRNVHWDTNTFPHLAVSRLFSVLLWQSVPCLCRICSLDTQNNISPRIISLLLKRGREKGQVRDSP